MALELVFVAIGCYLAGAVIALGIFGWKAARYLAAAAGTVGSLVLVVAAVIALTSTELTLTLPASTPLGGFEVRTNALAGMFLLLTGLLGTASRSIRRTTQPMLGGRRGRQLCSDC